MKAYPAYKDSGVEWIGEIPEHWTFTQIKRGLTLLTDYDANGSFSTIKNNVNRVEAKPEKYSWLVRATDLENKRQKNLESQDVVWVDKSTHDFLRKSYLNGGELLVAKRGEIGKVYLMPDVDYPATLGPNMYLARLDRSILIPKYSFFFFSIPMGREQLEIRNKSTTLGALYKDDFKDILIFYPPIEEQTTIANFLDHKTAQIDQSIARQRTLIELLQEHRVAIINEAVTKGINPEASMKDSGIEWIGEIPVHWEVKSMRYLFSFGRGLSITKKDLKEKGIPCLNYGEIHSKYGFRVDPDIHKLKCVAEEYSSDDEKSLLKRGDFVFADTSEDLDGAGNFSFIDSERPVFAGYHTVVLKQKEKHSYKFLAYQFDSKKFRKQVRAEVKGVKVYSVTHGILKSAKVLLPPPYEQISIAKFLDQETAHIDQEIAATQKEIELLEEYRQALIAEAVTGKIDVRDYKLEE